MKLLLQHKTSDGKYTFQIFEEDWRVHVLRYEEPWHCVCGLEQALKGDD